MKIIFDDETHDVELGTTLKTFLKDVADLPIAVTVNGRNVPGSTVLETYDVIEENDDGQLIDEDSEENTVKIHFSDYLGKSEYIQVSTDPNAIQSFYSIPVKIIVNRNNQLVETSFLKEGDIVKAMPVGGTKGGR